MSTNPFGFTPADYNRFRGWWLHLAYTPNIDERGEDYDLIASWATEACCEWFYRYGGD